MTKYSFEKGQRVELHPATDAWMQGDRLGEIVGFGETSNGIKLANIRMNVSGRLRTFTLLNILPLGVTAKATK